MPSGYDPSYYHDPLHNNDRKWMQSYLHQFPAFLLPAVQYNLFRKQAVYHGRPKMHVHIRLSNHVFLPSQADRTDV